LEAAVAPNGVTVKRATVKIQRVVFIGVGRSEGDSRSV
jgi:hypothetical protein